MAATFLALAALVATDQLIKLAVVTYLKPVGTMVVIPGVLGLKYVENTGAAFGIFGNYTGVLIVVSAAALLVCAYFLFVRRRKGRMEHLALFLVLAGGVGNLIDRVANGFVVDYINLLFVPFAVFNFADCCVTVGFVLLLLAVIRAEVKARAAKRQAPAGAQPKGVADENGPL